MAEYIEREALLGAIDCEFFKTDPDGAEQIGVLKCRRIAHTLPAADVAPVVHGEWVHCNGTINLWYCSECGEKILYNPTRRTYNIRKRPVYEVNKYCRGCGAKMDGGRRSE